MMLLDAVNAEKMPQRDAQDAGINGIALGMFLPIIPIYNLKSYQEITVNFFYITAN